MSNDCYAPRELTGFRPRRSTSRYADVGDRLRRGAALLAQLLGLYVAARCAAPSLAAAARGGFVQRWAERILGALRVSVLARGHLPGRDAPVLLVANHVSWLDSYALNSVNAARFVAKSEVGTWPLIATIAARCGTIFLKRGCIRAAARTVAVLTDALCAGQPVAVFPEGTTSGGDDVLRFYPAMFQAAVRSGAPVQPVAIRYRGAGGAPTRAAAYVGDMSVLDSVRAVLREPRLTVELIFCAPLDPQERDRKQLAAAARAAIAAALHGYDSARPSPLRSAA